MLNLVETQTHVAFKCENGHQTVVPKNGPQRCRWCAQDKIDKRKVQNTYKTK